MNTEINTAGLYVALEGPDGGGKGTQSLLFGPIFKNAFPNRRMVFMREPGGTDISEQIRTVLLSAKNHGMTKRCEVLLFSAARAQVMEELIEPALEKGFDIFAERYFLSSMVYQGIALGLGLENVKSLSNFAVDSRWPDLTLVLDIPVEETMKRKHHVEKDRIELRDREFHQKVRDGYLFLASQQPEKIEVIDGMLPIEEVHRRIWMSTLKKLHETKRITEEEFLKLR